MLWLHTQLSKHVSQTTLKEFVTPLIYIGSQKTYKVSVEKET